MRLLPDRLRISSWARFYRGKHSSWLSLYRNSNLLYAPSIRMALVPGDVISDCIAFTGLYEPHLTRRIVKLAKIGGLFVDVGANLGYFSLLWAAHNPNNICFALEASPRNLEILRENIVRNGLESRVHVIPKAAGQVSGVMDFDLGPTDQTGWGGFTNTPTINTIKVEVVRIDDVVPEGCRVRLLKVDVEGAEPLVLMGCQQLLAARAIDEIWFEQNKPRLRALHLSEDSSQKFLLSLGYISRPLGSTSSEVVEWIATPSE